MWILLALLLLLTACTTSETALPSYAYKTEEVRLAYEVATKYPEIGEAVPCYCGCVRLGHKNLRECYITPEGEYTEHASRCQLCIAEMVESYYMYRQGASLKEIREVIDGKYGEGYAEPTPTPLP